MVDKNAIQAAKAQLLAIVAMSDDKERDIKKSNAFTLFEIYDADNAGTLQQIYLSRMESKDSFDIEVLCEMLITLSSIEKADFLRDCWYVAACDKKLVESEKKLINLIAGLLGISKDDSALALKSVG